MADDHDVVSQDQPETEDADTEQTESQISVASVEDVGPLRKKVTVDVPRELIQSKVDENFGQLSQSAQVPGFRIGRAPRRLIEKRFGKDVNEQVRLGLIGEAVEQGISKSELKTIGKPDFDLEKIEMPDEGAMSFSFEVEVWPEFDLPELKGIAITKPSPEVTDKDIDEQVESLRWRYAELEEADNDAEVDENDRIAADLRLELPDKDPVERSTNLDVHAQSIDGIPFPDLAKQLKGMKAGQSREIQQTIPDDYEDESLRGKEARLTITAHHIHKWKLPEADEALAGRLGLGSVDQLRSTIRTELESQKGMQIRRAMEQQVRTYLLEKTEFDIPPSLADRQASRALMRRVMELVRMGTPRVMIEKYMDELRARSREEVVKELKLQFITGKIGELLEIQIGDEEINGAIAEMAAGSGRRPERMREELIKEGTYESVGAALLETKVLARLVEDADVTEESSDSSTKDDQTEEGAK